MVNEFPSQSAGKDAAIARKVGTISFVTIFLIVILDRASKVFFTHVLDLGESIAVIRNVFHFTLVHNTGIAFGLFRDHGFFFIFLSLAAVILFSVYLYRNRYQELLSTMDVFAFSLIIAGAVGNLWDRVLFGHVIDFIDFRIWPVFNVADSAITIGTMILLVKCIPFYSK